MNYNKVIVCHLQLPRELKVGNIGSCQESLSINRF